MKTQNNTIATIREIHATKGWNGVYAYLKKAGVKYTLEAFEFGLDSKTAKEAKEDFLKTETGGNEFRAHYYSVLVRARRNGFTFNRIRAQRVVIS